MGSEKNKENNICPEEIAETLSGSLSDTQNAATDTKAAVQDVLLLSGNALHEKAVNAILADPELRTREKILMFREEKKAQMEDTERGIANVLRLQKARKETVMEVTDSWAESIAGTALGILAAVFFLGTPQGRRLLFLTEGAVAKR